MEDAYDDFGSEVIQLWMRVMFAPIVEMFQAGAWLIVRTLLFYIVIPELVMMFIIGYVFRIRGKLFGFIMTLITLVLFYIFAMYGLPYITEESTKLANGV